MNRSYAALLALALTVAVAGCHPATPETTPMTFPATSPTATPPSTPPAADVTVHTSADGTTVRLRRGQRLVVVLDNTYWRFADPSGVLQAAGAQVVEPAPRGTCLPGVGCGTVRLTVVAATPGSGDVTASRTTCGEALACSPDQSRWVVHVVVS